ncbi:hypothetical protein HUO09_17260 [Vibrio sp. Y2-5]|uniref:hypothetical protein n=1 Tax=Vibrio sp. Y2-5 TaxID=2743977 RepID=UPI00166087D8|nr:hypothetical protein [Vibrio sp. Y2-5]MBD0788105.1 hypothetical protein [Vibrio sp. Y2-5]
MFGVIPFIQEKAPKLEETRVRINEDSFKVSRVNLNAPVFFDPKGDFEQMEGIVFYSTGQLSFAEWLKKLSKSDTAPRGACFDYFAKNARFRR